MNPLAVPYLKAYARQVRDLRRANPAVPETALAPSFQRLLADLLSLYPLLPRLTVVPEYARAGVGRPDIAFVQTGAPARAFTELKAPDKPADPFRWRGQDKRQFERFAELSSWSACNFHEFCRLHRGDLIGRALVVPERALRPDVSDLVADRLVAELDNGPFLELLEQLFQSALSEPAAQDAQHLAKLMAHSARLVRGIIRDRLAELGNAADPDHPLIEVRREFQETLYAHPEVAGYKTTDFNALFSAAFAQTLAFGMLLVREATGMPVGQDAWRQMPAEHPLMRTALRVLSQPEVVEEIGIGFDVMRDTVNSFAPALLAIGADGRDPILYFYEDFLETFDPDDRDRYGVFYTPLKVVRYMVGALDRALRDNLGTAGLRDPAVTILDPAAGTGTFLLGIAERVRADAAPGGDGDLALTLRDLATRMFGFELLVGPYAVAHYRLHHALNRPGVAVPFPRLGIYLADTLAEPGAAAPAGPLGFVARGIGDERAEANRIKTEQPILAIIGNPPYRRLEEGENRTLVGRWMDGLWDDLKAPVRDAGWGNQLNTFPELSVAFWRWALWKLFEADNAPRRGVVAFITNRKFLTGKPYAGLRKMMRERFDRIEIIDLRGDVRRGERAGVEADAGVFNIQVGTAITLAIADGSKPEGALADVVYLDAWAEARISRRAKLDWLEAGAGAGALANGVAVERDALDDLRPLPFQNGEWIGLRDAFQFSKSGMKSGNDEMFVTIRRSELQNKITPALENHANNNYDTELERFFDYRPLDRRWFFNDLRMLNRPGPDLQRVWGAGNTCLCAMPGGTGAGPAAWCYDLLPDYHSFRGSYGGYAFPLYDRRHGPDAHNLSPHLLEELSTAYGFSVAPEEVFNTILCLLSASTYSLLFAEDLEDTFPHVPFPASPEIFAQAARLGAEIRAVQTFARPVSALYRTDDVCRLETEPTGTLASVDHQGGSLALCADGSGRLTGIPEHVWRFSVSGYRVLPRWLEARIGLPVDLVLVNEIRDICGRIAELVDLFVAADTVLRAALADTLLRGAIDA